MISHAGISCWPQAKWKFFSTNFKSRALGRERDLHLLTVFRFRMAAFGQLLPLQVDCPHFASKTFKMPKKSKFTVGSIPAVSTTE